jgi:hypothetical protein
MAAVVFDKFDLQGAKEVQKVFNKKLPDRYSRLRSKMVKYLDNYYFKELPHEEAYRQIKEGVQISEDTGIHNLD